MAKIKWTKKATKDLQFIHEYISADSSFYADRYVDKLMSRVDQLVNMPESGRFVPEVEGTLTRELIEGNYRIFYQFQKSTVYILRIHHAARNIRR